MKKAFIVSLVIFPLALASLSGPVAIATTYSTTFNYTENPISDGGNWVGGQTAGNNLWGNCQTNGTMVFGVSEPTTYGDPTAILTGTWGANQTAQATVKIVSTPTISSEAEVRLRMTINSTTHTISGYEVYCSVDSGNPYCHIARWNGPNGAYCNIESSTPSVYLINGDTLKGTVTGTSPVVVTGYVIRGGSTIATWTANDTGQNCSPGGPAGPFTTGAPGLGFYDSQDNNWSAFGFSYFTATDGTTPTQYTVTFQTDGTPGATLTGTLTQTVNQGANCTAVTAKAPANYYFVNWTGTGGFSSASNPVTVTNVTQDMTITANFAVTPQYTVTFQTDGTPGATLTGNTTQTVNQGANCTAVTAKAPANYYFLNWTGTGGFSSTKNPVTVTNVTQNMTITANFAHEKPSPPTTLRISAQ